MDIIDFFLCFMISVCAVALIWCQILQNRLKADDAKRQCEYEIRKMHMGDLLSKINQQGDHDE